MSQRINYSFITLSCPSMFWPLSSWVFPRVGQSQHSGPQGIQPKSPENAEGLLGFPQHRFAAQFHLLSSESDSFTTGHLFTFATASPTFVILCLPFAELFPHLLWPIPDIQWLLPGPRPTHRTWSNPLSWPKLAVVRLRMLNPWSSLAHSVETKCLVGNQNINHLTKWTRETGPWLRTHGPCHHRDGEGGYMDLLLCSQRMVAKDTCWFTYTIYTQAKSSTRPSVHGTHEEWSS